MTAISSSAVQAAPGFQALSGHIPAAVSSAQPVAPLAATHPVPLALTLPLHHQAELADLLHGLSSPGDPRYGHYLTPAQFAARFSPTQAEYAQVIAYAKSVGLTVTGTHPNRTLLDVSAPASQVEKAFGLHLGVYRASDDGRAFYAPDAEPKIPTALASLITGVVGLDNASPRRSHAIQKSLPASPLFASSAMPAETGSGPGGGLTPADIKTAYNLNSVAQTGTGQVLGLYELDGYTPSDITAYENQYGLPHVPLQNVAVDGGIATPGGGAGEVTLDIELQLALAPNASKIVVYEAPNGTAGIVDAYTQIATDNIAQEISTSWGIGETHMSPGERNAESAAFQQMAAQGQSIYAAAGDGGAYDRNPVLTVDDPASDPFMVGVGGTAIATNGPGGSYNSESTWVSGSGPSGFGGGGGISVEWPIPSYQQGIVGSAASQGSTTQRNVPDVSLDADPGTGYSIYFTDPKYGSGFYIYGGTSCAAPLWAAFTALVNQKRVGSGLPLLGFANPAIYNIASSASYVYDFHDIADGSNNLYYPAVAGYDDATGWGTFNGANLLLDLSAPVGPAPTLPAAPTGLTATPGNAQIALAWTGSAGATRYSVYRSKTSGSETLLASGVTSTSFTDTGLVNGTPYFYKVAAVNGAGTSPLSAEAGATPKVPVITQILGNTGFENGSAKPAPWVATPGVVDNAKGEPSHSGMWKAWLDGYGTTHTDTLSQTVTLPATLSAATLSFYLRIDSADRTGLPHDTLKVQIRSSSGTVLTTLATYTNQNVTGGYVQKSFNLAAYKGQTVQLYLVGSENGSLATSFVLDDFALNIQ